MQITLDDLVNDAEALAGDLITEADDASLDERLRIFAAIVRFIEAVRPRLTQVQHTDLVSPTGSQGSPA